MLQDGAIIESTANGPVGELISDFKMKVNEGGMMGRAVADVNFWGSALSAAELRRWTTCKCGSSSSVINHVQHNFM